MEIYKNHPLPTHTDWSSMHNILCYLTWWQLASVTCSMSRTVVNMMLCEHLNYYMMTAFGSFNFSGWQAGHLCSIINSSPWVTIVVLHSGCSICPQFSLVAIHYNFVSTCTNMNYQLTSSMLHWWDHSYCNIVFMQHTQKGNIVYIVQRFTAHWWCT